jgi:hypothetical protein
MRAVFAVEQAVKSAWLLRTPPSSTASSISSALGGILLAARGLTSGGLVGDVVHLLLIAAVPTGVCLRGPCPSAVGLWRVFGLPLRLDFCAGGALQILHISQTADTAPGGSWAGP